MALKAVIASLNEVDEKYRDLYVQKGDKFEIQVEGVKTPGDVDRVQKALNAERTAHEATKAAAKDAADKLAAFGELTPEEVQAQAEKIANFEAANTPELAKNFEKIVSDRVEAGIVTRLKQETGKLTKTIDTLTNERNTLATDNEKFKLGDIHRTIDDNVRSAATKAKVQEGAVVDALIRARNVFQVQDGRVVTPDGQTPEEWLEERKKDAGHWWPAARGAGAGGGNENFNVGGDNPWSREGWNMTKQGDLVKQNPAKAEQLAQAAGVKLGSAHPAPAAR